jgi:hypothetical protein
LPALCADTSPARCIALAFGTVPGDRASVPRNPTWLLHGGTRDVEFGSSASGAKLTSALRVRRPVKPVRRWGWGRGCNRCWAWRVGESWHAGRSRPASGSHLGCRIVITFQVFGSDENEARAGEVHEWMTANTAESHDGSPAPRAHLDRIGTRLNVIANGPFACCCFVALVYWLPVHAATPLTDLPRPSFAARTCRRARPKCPPDTSVSAVQVPGEQARPP